MPYSDVTDRSGSFVEKTLSLDIWPAPGMDDPRAGMDIDPRIDQLAHKAGIVGLRRITRVNISDQDVVYESRGGMDDPDRLSHSELNGIMDARAAELAEVYGGPAGPLPIVSAWGSRYELFNAAEPIAFAKKAVFAGHVALYLHAAFRMSTPVPPEGPPAFRVIVDTAHADELPMDYFNVIGVGAGWGTPQQPDWRDMHAVVEYSTYEFDRMRQEGGDPSEIYSATLEGIDKIFATIVR